MFEKLGPEAREIVVLSQKIAQSMGHGEVRGEHLLLALFKQLDETLASEFADIGITCEQIFSAVKADQPGKDSVLEGDLTELSPEAQIIIARSAQEAKRLDSKLILPKHLFIAFEWYGVAERGNFYAWELMKKSGPEHKIRALFGNIEFRTPTKEKSKVVVQGKTDSPKLAESKQVQEQNRESNDWIAVIDFPYRHSVLEAAQFAALKHGHNKVNSLFLLLGMALRPNTVASIILEEISLNPNKLEKIIYEHFGRGPWVNRIQMFYASSIYHIYRSAGEIAEELSSETIEDEHFLQAIVRTGKSKLGCMAWDTICDLEKQYRLESLLDDPSQLESLSSQKHNQERAVRELRAKAQEKNPYLGKTDFFSKATINLLSQAKEESLLLKHEYIEPEHLFLAMQTMPSLDIIDIIKKLELEAVKTRKAIENIAGKARGKKATDRNLALGEATKLLLESAFTESRQLGKTQIEPVHVLLAIAKKAHDENEDSVLSQLLGKLQLESKLISEVIMNLLSKEIEPEIARTRQYVRRDSNYQLPDNFSETSCRVVENAHKEACRFGYPEIEPEHLLLGLIKETSNEVSNLFISRGVCVKTIEQEFSKFKDRGPGGSSKLRVSDIVQEIFNLASKECSDEVEPQDLLGYLILSMDLTTINVLRSLGMEDLLEGAADFAPPVTLLNFLNSTRLDDYYYSTALKIILRAQELTRQFGHRSTAAEHLLLALLEWNEDPVIKALIQHGLKLDKLKTDLRAIEGVGSTFNTKEIPLAQSTIDAMRKATELVDEFKSGALEPGHLMLGILTNQCKTTKKLLSKYDLPVDINDQLVIALGGKDEK